MDMDKVKSAIKYLESDAKVHADRFSELMLVSTRTIIAIAEAFRELEQRAEAAEAARDSNLKSAQYSAETNRKISRKNGEMHDEITSLKADCENWSNQCAALIKERDALATENLAIQDFDIIDFMESGPYQPNDPTLQSLKTPATDAYANHLRAEGVEIFLDENFAALNLGRVKQIRESVIPKMRSGELTANNIAGDDRCERCGVRFTRPDGAHYCHKKE